MSLFTRLSNSSQFLNAPSRLPSRKLSQGSNRPRDEVDEFLSSDLEISFASTMSLHSPVHDPIPLTPEGESPQPMDISPAPKRDAIPTHSPHNGASVNLKPATRPRAFTSATIRPFGRDMSNASTPSQVPLLPKPGSSQSQNKRIQRSALPAEWLSFSRPSDSENVQVSCTQPLEPPFHTSSTAGDAMDVDTSFYPGSSAPVSSPVPFSAAPTITGFDSLFYDTMSPGRGLDSYAEPQPKKRRSASPDSSYRLDENATSSPAPPSSPSQRKLDRITSGPLVTASLGNKVTLHGLGNPPALGNRKARRPVLSAMVHPSQAVHSAYPSLESRSPDHSCPLSAGLPPTRRAFSAMLPATMSSAVNESSSDEFSFDGPEVSSPAQAYAKRQQVKTIRRCDGTDDFRPSTGATAMISRDLESSPSSKLPHTGLPGFGDNESHGKILPCHRVKEDGLMRISSRTLDELLDGVYNSQIAKFHIIDCRFEYEYNGGHIPDAMNINTAAGIEEFFLGPGSVKPKPCTSGDSEKKMIIIFHCEFSAVRAPTLAKHLRSKDRAANNHLYPKIHYPEVYVLEGGYSQYFRESAARCQPSAYVSMDDPGYAVERNQDMDHFRKGRFGRTKSYAYGEGKLSTLSQQTTKRNTAPTGGPITMFAAANAARTRRGGAGALTTLVEDGNTTLPSDEDDIDLGDSPCPPPNKATMPKVKTRGPLTRAETYGPARMAY